MATSSTVDMRSELVDAALAVLQRDGAAGFTVRNITQEAGCSTTGVYTYFGGKHGLVEAIFLAGFGSFDEAVAPGLEVGDLAAAGRAYRRWALEHRTQYMVMFGGAVPDYEPSESARERALMSFAGLSEGVGRAFPGRDVAERAYHLFATVHGYVMLEMAGMSAATEQESEALYERALADLGAATMTIWVGLLHGVNVGGGNKLPMADFRASVASLGYRDVATYIQSGNVVFGGDDDEATTAERLRRVLHERHGLTVPVVVRSGDELTRVIERHPDAGGDIDPKFLHVAFLDRAPDPHAVAAIEADRWTPDAWSIDGRELFLTYPAGSGRSKMTIDRFEAPWAVVATARNLNSVAKLVELVTAVG